jgi:hypothetical protein
MDQANASSPVIRTSVPSVTPLGSPVTATSITETRRPSCRTITPTV